MTLDELKAKYAAMTNGPWEDDDHSTHWSIHGADGHIADVRCYRSPLTRIPEADANCRGIVALHNAFPAIVERFEAMRAALKEAEWAQMDEDGNWMCPVCDRFLSGGKHSPTCSVAAALTIADKPLGGGSA